MSRIAHHSQRWLSASSAPADQIACLRDVRSVLRLSGPTLIHFLQGLVTNDVTQLEHPHPLPMYACILNAQGRYLHDLFLHPSPPPSSSSSTTTTTTLAAAAADDNPESSTTLFIDTHADAKEDLLRLLKRYRLRQKIDIDDVSEELEVWTRFGSRSSNSSSSSSSPLIESPNSSNAQNNGEKLASSSTAWRLDPRLPSLGYRAIFSTAAADSIHTPSLTPTASQNSSTTAVQKHQQEEGEVPWQVYRSWRIAQGVAEGDAEIPSGEAIALEYNIDGLHGISFTKGCYVGQELMARTHFKGVVRKRVMPFHVVTESTSSSSFLNSSSTLSTPCTIQQGESVVDRSTGKSVGVVRAVVVDDDIVEGGGHRGLAVLRLKEAQEVMDGSKEIETESGVRIRPWRPHWWPQSWGREG